MGGRGASSGVSVKGKKYGTEYRTLLQYQNIKFVSINGGKSATPPMETMTKKRIYVTINDEEKIKSIDFYNDSGKRVKQIDVTGRPHIIDGERVLPHTHFGYFHEETGGTKRATKSEQELIDKVKRIWNNRR
ncbi:hypothetical protein LMB39_08665 [Limosilactobacillus reuteri]|uniref:hypothetical protein n=1 Tax=Limosilactobacillus reuteri TaxID=1598 RepID=UPI001E3C0A71|nr:hypothetical protein [Limosilactobacillus reuteri]MCC4345075.1 hypothetical protein [Limosilactobacillus reuteri]MCC4347643.1 hypothetical protein [Limosilactobacillus reuteri]MCC4357015.1 hypothetical protein [Limosilactobacillus reuteri]MCC4385982.1 hypothetical protein [Limosilactobacillus reuteri]MCC4471835.1 hypothetical protein [Limosilactobacillus reuteri]